jgi:5'-3' exonuclease
MKALFDSDIFAYRAASACEDEDEATAQRTLDRLIVDTLMCGVDNIYPDCFVDSWGMHLTGKNNFRYKIATTVPYKGNRVDKPKPKHLAFLRSYLVKEWGASISEGEEADDTIAIEATKLGDNCVIVSLDKDLDQIVGWHYNFVKRLGYYITPEEALVKLYTQMITGDAADNIKGLFRVGPVKAAKIIGDTTNELELYNKVLEAYEGDAERVLENAQLLFLRRYEGQVWTPPQA